MAFLSLKTEVGTEYRVFYPEDERQQYIFEAEFYFLKTNAIELVPHSTDWRVFVHGIHHGTYTEPMFADLAMREALDGEL